MFDVNENGLVNSADAVLPANYLAGTVQELPDRYYTAGDLNGDGVENCLDLVGLLLYLV